MVGAAGAGADDAAGMEHDAADVQRAQGAVPLLATQVRLSPLGNQICNLCKALRPRLATLPLA